MLVDFLDQNEWKVVDKQVINSREQALYSFDCLNIKEQARKYLGGSFPNGLYLHQKEAIKALTNGQNVCLLTGTSSGKSMVFYTAAIDILARNHKAKIVAIYPLKALGREQESRWREALQNAEMPYFSVGRIDGDILPLSRRKNIIKNCQVIIMTPDIIHAWLMANIGDRDIAKFLTSISLVVVDEVHTYTGVFGSNSAFLFRRLRHLMAVSSNKPQFICASATIANPEVHLANLFGLQFHLIGPEIDTSPRHEVEIALIRPPRVADFMTEITKFLKEISQEPERFIVFIDSRKQAEMISSILSRSQLNDEDESETPSRLDGNLLEILNVLPYRAGYEEDDQQMIQKRLSCGTLKGVISTSALELGLDIPHLGTAILIGVPYSKTSLLQRIGRIGRHDKGKVYIIHSGSFLDEIIFRNPNRLFNRPLGESALYLQNPRVQYIHALCLARLGGEHDQIYNMLGKSINESDFTSPIDWPEGFKTLCKSERIGEIPVDLQAMKAEAGDDPNHTYPLRDVESQFRVQLKQGPIQEEKGSLSFSQLMREAYPGAVYYYATQPLRVYKVIKKSRLVYVRKEKRYTTSPKPIFTQIFPNLTSGNIYEVRRHSDLLIFESNIQVRESVTGYEEKRGSKKPEKYLYPLNELVTNVYFDSSRFDRNYFTSGVILTHPAFNDISEKEIDTVAKLLYEAFLMSIPFERQDIDFAVGKHRIDRPPIIEQGTRFIAIYDKTYGSLRLSGHVMREDLMRRVFEQTYEIANLTDYQENGSEEFQITPGVLSVIMGLKHSALSPGATINHFSLESQIKTDVDGTSGERVIKPGSIGLAVRNNNQEYLVEKIFYNPKLGQLCYRGRYVYQKDGDNCSVIWPISDIAEIPGESEMGLYNYETGELS